MQLFLVLKQPLIVQVCHFNNGQSQPCLFTVCVGVLKKFQEHAGKDVDDVEKSEAALKEFCKTLKGKEDSFVSRSQKALLFDCYFLVLLHWCLRNVCYQDYWTSDKAVIVRETNRKDLQRFVKERQSDM